jgi:hypothetical protein
VLLLKIFLIGDPANLAHKAKYFFEFLEFADFLIKEASRFIDFSKATDYN